MKFIPLTKYFYQHTQEEYEIEYIRRLEAPFTVHFNIPIHQYNRKSAYPAFLCYTGEILRLVEKFYKTYEQFLYTVNTVPPVVLYQFTRLSIVEEVKSTNDIEGVHSTKKEIREIIEKKGTHYHRLQSVVHQYLELLGEEEIKFDTCQDIRNSMMILPIRKLLGKIRKTDWMGVCLERNRCRYKQLQEKQSTRDCILKAGLLRPWTRHSAFFIRKNILFSSGWHSSIISLYTFTPFMMEMAEPTDSLPPTF